MFVVVNPIATIFRECRVILQLPHLSHYFHPLDVYSGYNTNSHSKYMEDQLGQDKQATNAYTWDDYFRDLRDALMLPPESRTKIDIHVTPKIRTAEPDGRGLVHGNPPGLQPEKVNPSLLFCPPGPHDENKIVPPTKPAGLPLQDETGPRDPEPR
jgi:hypothetical protein